MAGPVPRAPSSVRRELRVPRASGVLGTDENLRSGVWTVGGVMNEHETSAAVDGMWEGDFLTQFCLDLYCLPVVPPVRAEGTELGRHRPSNEPRRDFGSARTGAGP